MEPKHSGLGIASFAISCLMGFMIFALVAVAGVMEVSTPGGIDEESPFTVLLGLAIIGALGLDLVGFGLGIAAFFQQDRKLIFAILGVVFSGITVLGTLGLIVIGNMA